MDVDESSKSLTLITIASDKYRWMLLHSHFPRPYRRVKLIALAGVETTIPAGSKTSDKCAAHDYFECGCPVEWNDLQGLKSEEQGKWDSIKACGSRREGGAGLNGCL